MCKVNHVKQSNSVSPNGIIINVDEADGNIRHIGYVINHPEVFGLEKEYIENLYTAHNEPLGVEGKAREVIMRDLLKRNWVRIRLINANSGYVVQTFNLNSTKDNIWNWVAKTFDGEKPIDSRDVNKYTPITILTGDQRITSSADELLHGKYLYENAKKLMELQKEHTLNKVRTIIREELKKNLVEDMTKKDEFVMFKSGVWKGCSAQNVFGRYFLNESSLSRVLQHTKKGFMMLSASKSTNTEEENLIRYVTLKEKIRSLDCGYIELFGVYTYDNGKTEKELSLLVPYKENITPDEFRYNAMRLMSEFDQESIFTVNQKIPLSLDFSIKTERK